MAIKNKDGSVYKLRGPNPLMQTQQEWDRSKLNLFNIGAQKREIVIEAKPEDHITTIKKTPVKPKARVIEARKFIEEIKSEPVAPVIQQQIPPKPREDDQATRLLKERGVTFYCAPAISRTVKDDFYGNSYGVLEYGDKYEFRAVPIDESDLELQFWCLDAVTTGSVIYRKDRRGERWWRIRQAAPESGGWLVNCIPSDSSPDFS